MECILRLMYGRIVVENGQWECLKSWYIFVSRDNKDGFL